MEEPRNYLRGGSYSWDEAVAYAVIIWGPSVWRSELARCARKTERTLYRWEAAGRVPGMVSAMIHAFMRLRKYSLQLPEPRSKGPQQ